MACPKCGDVGEVRNLAVFASYGVPTTPCLHCLECLQTDETKPVTSTLVTADRPPAIEIPEGDNWIKVIKAHLRERFGTEPETSTN